MQFHYLYFPALGVVTMLQQSLPTIETKPSACSMAAVTWGFPLGSVCYVLPFSLSLSLSLLYQ